MRPNPNKETERRPKMTDTLGDALPREMARVRDEVLPYYTPEVNGQIAAAMMRQDLDAAAKALVEGDVSEMIRVYESLKTYHV